MSKTELLELRIELDPWTKRPENRLPMPKGVLLVCAYDLHVGVDSVMELVCFRRTAKKDELWVA